MKEIGIKLKNLRRENNYKQEHLAERLQCSIATYCKLETGCTDLTYTRLTQLAEIYGLKLYELFYDDQRNELLALEDVHITTITSMQSEIMNLQRKVIRLHEELRTNIAVKQN